MASSVMVLFMAVEKKEISLPIKDWTIDLKDLLEKAHDNLPESRLICTGGRGGRPLYVLREIKNYYKLPGLSFINKVCTTLQGTELVIAIQSLTIILNKFLCGNEVAKNIVMTYIFGTEEIDYLPYMKKSFAESEVYQIQDLDWESEGIYVLFCLVKALIFVLSDALANNKIFLYIEPEI